MNVMIEGYIVISILKFPFLSCIPFIKAENLQKLSAHQILLTSVVTKLDFSIWSVNKVLYYSYSKKTTSHSTMAIFVSLPWQSK